MKRVVIAPLDWGLGHVTRCIPIIRELLSRGCQVYIASSGSALKLLQHEFPQVVAIQIESYKARYASRLPLMLAIFFQLPRFFWVIQKEHTQLQKIIKEHVIDLIISDNRYGCWSKSVPSIFITHQTNILMPAFLKIMQPVINYFNARYINRFTHCWIPDTRGDQNLTGILSKLSYVKIPSRHVGILSRFTKSSDSSEFKYRIAAVLSGPEPQRSILEEKLKMQLQNLSYPVILVKGVVEDKILLQYKDNVSIVNFLPSDQLEEVIKQSEIVISRSGYSSIMDLVALEKMAILIPTPGQTEQEYLAERLMHKGICFSMNQYNFNLDIALKKSLSFKGFANIENSNQMLNTALNEFLES